jgi:hypothetical protein
MKMKICGGADWNSHERTANADEGVKPTSLWLLRAVGELYMGPGDTLDEVDVDDKDCEPEAGKSSSQPYDQSIYRSQGTCHH